MSLDMCVTWSQDSSLRFRPWWWWGCSLASLDTGWGLTRPVGEVSELGGLLRGDDEGVEGEIGGLGEWDWRSSGVGLLPGLTGLGA